jgi:hypothetical protein
LIKPLATFTIEGYEVLIFLYPSIIHGGFTLVACGTTQKDELLVQHECEVCRDSSSIASCPYVQSAIKLYKESQKKVVHKVNLLKHQIGLHERFIQVPTPYIDESIDIDERG